MSNELLGATAFEIASLVRSGAASAVDVANAFADRIDRADKHVRAFAAVRDRDAIEADARAIADRSDLAELPLAGVPIAVKDSLRIDGLPRRLGSAATPATPATADDELVRRVKQAGAVVLGSTTMPELGLWGFTQADVYGGATRNPWDRRVTPGGSSGGSAASVSANMAPIAIGSDGLGSIRIPASCCGLFGIKPGAGLLPPAEPTNWFGQTEFGSIATTIEDATLLLSVLAGESVAPEPPRPRRIAVWMRAPAPGVGVDSDVRAAIEEVADQLGRIGHQVTRVKTPRPIRTAYAILRRWFAFAADDVRAIGLDESMLEPLTRAHVRRGRKILARRPPSDREGEVLRRLLASTFDHYDLVLSPTLAQPPMPITDCSGRAAWVLFRLIRFAPFTGLWNLAQYPSASVPAGIDRSGLPVGAMLSGPPDSEAAILSVAREIEQHRPWRRHAPD